MPLINHLKKVLVIGSGPIIIGQAAEFDYAGTQACLALKEEGLTIILVNDNPATIMTDNKMADKVYIEPLTLNSLEKIIKKERPQGLIGTLGGQAGLNLSVSLFKKGILKKYQVKLLGTSVKSIQEGEDRQLFKELMQKIKEPIAQSKTVHSYLEGKQFLSKIGYPAIIRPAFTLGGTGGGFIYNKRDLKLILKRGLEVSPIHEVLIEKSLKGWKEIEYEVMRDNQGTCIIVCNMENVDPVGIHTGDSIVVAPSQTLSDRQYQILRNAALKIVSALKIIGGCNIQFALDPKSNNYRIIEVNPRVSRSSALASKATGYPIARTAAKCSVGYRLDEIINPITQNTFASFEPMLDYVVVKLPRLPFDKFPEANHKLGTQMKATGETMAIDRTFESSLNKAVRSLEIGLNGLTDPVLTTKSNSELIQDLVYATDQRLFAICELIRRGYSVSKIHKITFIDKWFLNSIFNIIQFEKNLQNKSLTNLTFEDLKKAKLLNIGNDRLATLLNIPSKKIHQLLDKFNIKPSYHMVDTCAGEFKAKTPYYYSSWFGEDEIINSNSKQNKILIIGSGPIRIGQGIEFDYCSVKATLAVKRAGFKAIVINNNPETVSTDYSVADRLYFEPLTIEDIINVADREHIKGVLIQYGGQTAIKTAQKLQEHGISILGMNFSQIDKTENREIFNQFCQQTKILHPKGLTVNQFKELPKIAKKIGYPVLIRPSFVIGGKSMFIFHHSQDLKNYLKNKHLTQNAFPLLVDPYIKGTECELDAVSDGKRVLIPGIFQHIERSGVHSGDSITCFPSYNLNKNTVIKILKITKRLSQALKLKGLLNIQFIIRNGQVFTMEVNPRASRTVPIASKLSGLNLVKIAVNVQLGKDLISQGFPRTFYQHQNYFGIKAPVYSFQKLKGADPILSPEMKSTGERLGISNNFSEAFFKAFFAGNKNNLLFKKSGRKMIICSLSRVQRQETLPLIKKIVHLGFKIIATNTTAKFLSNNHINCFNIEKNLKKIKELIEKKEILACLNLPTQGQDTNTFGYKLRQLALTYQIPTYTCLDTLKAIFNNKNNFKDFSTKAIQEYQQSPKNKKRLAL